MNAPGVQERFRLDRKVAVVTGGSRGIGRAAVHALAEAGAVVVIASRDEARCMAAAKEIEREGREAYAVPCDVAREDDLVRLFDRVKSMCGGTDVLVHAAGLSSVALAEKTARAELERMMQVHYLSGVRASQLAAAHMRERGGGSIVLTSSVWALGAATASLAYGSAKAALAHAAKVLALEWARHHIRVNAVAPGLVETDMTSELDDRARAKLLDRIPMRRMGTPEELAGPIVFLASPAASYLTGHVLVVDGGERAR